MVKFQIRTATRTSTTTSRNLAIADVTAAPPGHADCTVEAAMKTKLATFDLLAYGIVLLAILVAAGISKIVGS
jgi:hypothetical protein